MRQPVAALFGVALVVGCSTPMAELRKEVSPLATAELKCPDKKLTYEELEKLLSTTRVRVRGCGREAVYRMEESRWKKEPSR